VSQTVLMVVRVGFVRNALSRMLRVPARPSRRLSIRDRLMAADGARRISSDITPGDPDDIISCPDLVSGLCARYMSAEKVFSSAA
jgi:hypothetical protein